MLPRRIRAAFGTGAEDKHISTLDAEGVALAAIQGLNHKVEQLKTALREKASRVDDLEARLARLEKTLSNDNAAK